MGELRTAYKMVNLISFVFIYMYVPLLYIKVINTIHPFDADLMLVTLARCWTGIGSMHRVRKQVCK